MLWLSLTCHLKLLLIEMTKNLISKVLVMMILMGNSLTKFQLMLKLTIELGNSWLLDMISWISQSKLAELSTLYSTKTEK